MKGWLRWRASGGGDASPVIEDQDEYRTDTADFKWIVPEIVVTLFGLLVLLVEAFMKGKGSGRVTGVLTLIGAAIAFVCTTCLWGKRASLFNAFYVVDSFGTFFKLIFLAILFFVTIVSLSYARREEIFPANTMPFCSSPSSA